MKTASHPASVEVGSSHEDNSKTHRSYGWHSQTTFVPANTLQEFTLSSPGSISINELPEDATCLPSHFSAESSAGNATAAEG